MKNPLPIPTAWLAVFILAPILMVVVYAFLNADGGFTLHNFSYLPGFLPIFGRSFWLAFLSTAVCLVLGYPMAYLMSRLSASKQSLCMMLIMLPMWINFLLRTYAWMSILENNGFINQFFPFHWLNILPAEPFRLFARLHPSYQHAGRYRARHGVQLSAVHGAADLYRSHQARPQADRSRAGPRRADAPVFRRVIFPLSIPGVISGITMVFVPSVSTFVISQMLGSGKTFSSVTLSTCSSWAVRTTHSSARPSRL